MCACDIDLVNVQHCPKQVTSCQVEGIPHMRRANPCRTVAIITCARGQATARNVARERYAICFRPQALQIEARGVREIQSEVGCGGTLLDNAGTKSSPFARMRVSVP